MFGLKLITENEYDSLLFKIDDLKYDRDYYKRWYHYQVEQNKAKKELEQNMTNKVEFTKFRMSVGTWYEIVKKSDGSFVVAPGFATLEEATEKAREVAKLYPTEEFLIIAPVKVVRAEIPVVEEEFTVDKPAQVS